MSRPPFRSTPRVVAALLLVLALVLSISAPATATPFADTAADRAALNQGLLVRGPVRHHACWEGFRFAFRVFNSLKPSSHRYNALSAAPRGRGARSSCGHRSSHILLRPHLRVWRSHWFRLHGTMIDPGATWRGGDRGVMTRHKNM